MKTAKRFVVLGLAALIALSTSGCTFWHCWGGEPLTREELGDWLGIREGHVPGAHDLEALRSDLRVGPRVAGQRRLCGNAALLHLQLPGFPYNMPYTPVPDHAIVGTFPSWRHFIPSMRSGSYLFYPRLGATGASSSRQFCVSEDEWGAGLVVGDFLFTGETANAYDYMSGERLAARQSTVILGWGIGYTRIKDVTPLDAYGNEGLPAMGREYAAAPLHYNVRDGTSLLFGAVGWGRVNRWRYMQILWIPIRMGEVFMRPQGTVAKRGRPGARPLADREPRS